MKLSKPAAVKAGSVKAGDEIKIKGMCSGYLSE
jgi:hypothetical protein